MVPAMLNSLFPCSLYRTVDWFPWASDSTLFTFPSCFHHHYSCEIPCDLTEHSRRTQFSIWNKNSIISFTIASKIYLEVKVTNNLRELSKANFKTLYKIVKKILEYVEDQPCVWIGKINTLNQPKKNKQCTEIQWESSEIQSNSSPKNGETYF